MTFDPSAQRGAFDKGKAIGSDELRELRSQVWADGSVSSSEAERLFEMNRSVDPSPEWTDFFVEAISEFMLSQGEPRGYVTEDEATWLLRQINRDGRIETAAEIELIVKLLEHAEYAPPSLRRFALSAIEKTVLTGEGPTRSSGEDGGGQIADLEVALIRRLIFAPAGDGPAKVSAAEAQMLFRLKNATLGKENAASWKKLFVQGVANHLMARSSYALPSDPDQLRLERAFEAPLGNVLSTVGRASPALGDRLSEARKGLDPETDTGAPLEGGETDWLKRLYDKDAQHDEYDEALLNFLAEEGLRKF